MRSALLHPAPLSQSVRATMDGLTAGADLDYLPYALGQAIAKLNRDSVLEHAIGSLNARLGATGLPTSRVSSWSEFFELLSIILDVESDAVDTRERLLDLHRKLNKLSKRQRRDCRARHAPLIAKYRDRSKPITAHLSAASAYKPKRRQAGRGSA